MPPDPQRSPPASCLNTTKANLGLSPARARCGSGTCSPASPCRQTHVFPRMHPVGSQGQWGRRTPSVLPPGASASPCPAGPAATPGGAGPCAELSVHHHPHQPVPCGRNNPGCPPGTAGSPRAAFPAPPWPCHAWGARCHRGRCRAGTLGQRRHRTNLRVAASMQTPAHGHLRSSLHLGCPFPAPLRT